MKGGKQYIYNKEDDYYFSIFLIGCFYFTFRHLFFLNVTGHEKPVLISLEYNFTIETKDKFIVLLSDNEFMSCELWVRFTENRKSFYVA